MQLRRRAKEDRQRSPPRGELRELPQLGALRQEASATGDLLLLNGSAEIDQGGTSGIKTLPWWRHAARNLPGARWVGKADDDTFINVPALLARLPRDLPGNAPLFGTLKWG